MSRILIVEDQPAVAQALRVLLEVHDLPCVVASAADEALALVDREELGLVVQDMNFSPGTTSGGEGLSLFRRIRELDPELPILVVTAWTSLETAVQMVKEGASDYLAKPWDDTKLVQTARNLLRLRALSLENRELREAGLRERRLLRERFDLRGLVYESAAMHGVVSLACQVAAADVPILITGPNGAGKEKIAEIIQANSRRGARPFVKVNVGALPDELLESELFGAEVGAFTGASKRRTGRFEAADGGTLFLDEIGNLSAAGQTKLLRVLQTGEFERLGSSDSLRVDVRVIAATNSDLRALIAAGRFREDLLFRLNVIELHVSGLGERPEDVLPLATAFAAELAAAAGAAARPFSVAARAALCEHAWPGSVRELRNAVQRAMLVARGEQVEPADLGLAPPVGASVALARAELPAAERDERDRVEQVLVEEGGRVSRAAARLGLSRQALYRRMERLGLVLERRLRG